MSTTTIAIKKIARADGIIVGSDGNVYGWKCLACSTAHVFTNEDSAEQMADAVIAWRSGHASCAINLMGVL